MELNATFDTDAERYDRARPRYPRKLFDDLHARAGLSEASRVLEIAPATGIVTLPLARRGYQVTAVEMGANLASVARRNLAAYPNATVEVCRFEDWTPPVEPFDAICCATAFNWLDPAVRLEKCAAALRPGGHLAIWDTHHVAGGTSQFFVDVQECYERWDPATPPGLRLTPTGTSMSFAFINGRQSVTSDSTYTSTSTRLGEYTIGPLPVRVGGRPLESGPVLPKVLSSAAPAAARAAGHHI